MKLILDHHPIESIRPSIRSIGLLPGAAFREKFVSLPKLGRPKLSLNDIEHEILRAEFHEPRILIHEFADPREAELWREFQGRMHDKDFSGWLYQDSEGRPYDLGYWMGYKITKSYYERAADKRKAVRDILDIQLAGGIANPKGPRDPRSISAIVREALREYLARREKVDREARDRAVFARERDRLRKETEALVREQARP